MKKLNAEVVQFRGMRQEVSQILRKAISDGVYEPGEQIYEADLAKQLQLSRGPVREALLQLEKEALVRNIYNRGWFVVSLTQEQISEITSLRAILEVLALRLAKEQVTDDHLASLNEIQRTMIRAFDQRDISGAVGANFDFHRYLWKMSGHEILDEMLNRLTAPYFAFRKMAKLRTRNDLDGFRSGLEHHQTMIDFLAGTTNLSAETCVRNHFAPMTYKNWSRLLDAFQEDLFRRFASAPQESTPPNQPPMSMAAREGSKPSRKAFLYHPYEGPRRTGGGKTRQSR